MRDTREVILAECDRPDCPAKWLVVEDETRPVSIVTSTGTTYELDLCAEHEANLLAGVGIVALEAVTELPPPATPKPSASQLEFEEPPTSADPATPRRRTPRRRKPTAFVCQVDNECKRGYQQANSLRSHVHDIHGKSWDEVSKLVHEWYPGIRTYTRYPCPECKESFSNQMMARHRRHKHGVAA